MSCEKKELMMDGLAETSASTEKTEQRVGTFLKSPPYGPLPSDVIVPAFNTCNAQQFGLQDITQSSVWGISYPSPVPGNVGYELAEAFECSNDFSMCNVRPSGPAIAKHEIYFSLHETPSGFGMNPTNGVLYPIYTYMNDNMSPSAVETIKEHFACTINDYQRNYYSNPAYTNFIEKVDFYCDGLLCSCPNELRIITARVTFSIH
jgi:hypothetical protein